jgi:hypothetical protein
VEPETHNFSGELALSCNVATDRLVYQDVRDLSTTEPCSKALIWGRIKPKDGGMLSYPVLVISPPVYFCF